MTYDPSSSIVGYQPIRSGWRDVLIAHGAVPDVDMILTTYDQWCKRLNLDPNLALAQACHECTYFTSERWQGAAGVAPEWNPAGLGIVANNTPPNPFASPQEGIEAHCEHLCAYTYTAAACPVDHAHMADRRHTFHEGFTDLAGLERSAHWAFPGTGYVDSIVAIANSIGGTSVSAVPTEADLGYPGQVHWASGSGEAMDIANVRWFVIHDTEGHFSGDLQTLSGQISAHLLIDKDGSWAFMVPLDAVAYATGNINVNRQSISVEQSGFADAHDGGYTEPQYRCAAAFYRWCVAQGMVNVPAVYIGKVDADGGPEPDAPGILGHQDVPRDDGKPGWGGNYGHTDPGQTYQWDRLIADIGNAPPPPMDERFFPETNEKISGNFKGYWERFGTDGKGIALSMELFGFAVTPIVQENGIDVQYFERWVFEDHTAEGKGVLGRRLGAAAAKAAGHAGPGID